MITVPFEVITCSKFSLVSSTTAMSFLQRGFLPESTGQLDRSRLRAPMRYSNAFDWARQSVERSHLPGAVGDLRRTDLLDVVHDERPVEDERPFGRRPSKKEDLERAALPVLGVQRAVALRPH